MIDRYVWSTVDYGYGIVGPESQSMSPILVLPVNLVIHPQPLVLVDAYLRLAGVESGSSIVIVPSAIGL